MDWVVNKYKSFSLFFGLLFFFPTLSIAQDVISIPKITDPIVFDGRLNESFWKGLKLLNMVMYQPVYKGNMSEKSEVYLVYDNNYIYLAAKLYYRDTDDIRANSLFRDEYSADDTFALILDTFNDNENALWFFTNPVGVRFDALISNDGQEINFDWNTFWKVRTERTDWGWSIEMRIPFSSLGFQSNDRGVIMGVSIYRYLSKLNERYIYPATPPKWEDAYRTPSKFQEILLTGIESTNPIYVTPYFLGGLELQSLLNNNSTKYKTKENWIAKPGLDIKMNLSSNITMSLTVNTDFAQVEADAQRINLTRFPLFFPEKRQFFQERSSVFNFGFSRKSRLYHSRRIGLSKTGQPIQIYGGIRMVGKFNNTDIGFVSMQTAESPYLPSENFSILRVKRNVFNPYSTIGAMFTSRIRTTLPDNFAYGIDANIRVIGDEYLTFKVAQTYQSNNFDFLSNSRLYFKWQRRGNYGLNYSLAYDISGANFDPGIGFTPRNNFSYIQSLIEYKWDLDNSSLFRDIWVNNRGHILIRHSDNQVQSVLINPHLGINFTNGTFFMLQTNINYKDLQYSFLLSKENQVTVSAGAYWYKNIELRLEAPNGWKFRPALSMEWGSFFSGNKLTIGISTAWNPSPHFGVSSEYNFNNIKLNAPVKQFNTHIARVRLKTALNTHISLNTFLQYNSEIDKVSINARFRYNFGERNDLWIVYNNTVNTIRTQLMLPRRPVSSFQSFLIKYTYTFTL